jgi:hypothetical protein
MIKTKRNRTEYMRLYYQENKTERMAYNKRYSFVNSKLPHMRKYRAGIREHKRDFIFNFLGDKCVHCGFSDRRALQMDHINGRKGGIKLGNIDNRYKFVRDFPQDSKKIYQILCANCNWVKRDEHKEHFYHSLGPL